MHTAALTEIHVMSVLRASITSILAAFVPAIEALVALEMPEAAPLLTERGALL
jgi:hypothetical protein